MQDNRGIRLLSEKEAAQIIGQAVQTLRNNRWARRGLPYIRIGRSIRYQLGDILAYIDSRRIVPEGR